MLRSIFTFLLLFVFSGLAFGQQSFLFEQLPTETRMMHGGINCITQDSKGVLWLGTWSGLIRYDGYSVRTFQQAPGASKGLQGDQVTALVEDRAGRLWIGTVNSGFHCFDRATERFVNYRFNPDNPNSLSDNDVWGLFEDSKGCIWIGTKKGLNRFDPQTNTFLRIYAPGDSNTRPSSDYIYSICETPDGSIWSVTSRGLSRIKFSDTEHYRLRHYHLEPIAGDSFLTNFIYRVRPVLGEKNMIWVGSKAGLRKIRFGDLDSGGLQIAASYQAAAGNPASLSYNVVSDFWETADGNLWVATYHGLNLLEKNTGRFRRFFAQPNEPYSLSNNFIRSLYQDRTGILWIGTDKGVNKLNLRRKPFQSVRFDQKGIGANSIVSSICNGGTPGSLWVATNGGLNRINTITTPLDPPIHYTLAPTYLTDFANFITAVWRDPEGWLWLSTQGAGILRVHERDIPPNGGTISRIQQFSQSGAPLINDNYVMHFCPSTEGGVWFGLWDGGLTHFDPRNNTLKHFQTVGDLNLTATPNVSLLEKKENGRSMLYVGTRGNGLLKFLFDPVDCTLHLERQYRFIAGQKGCLSNNKINALFNDSRDRLWVCTSRGVNLLEADGNSFRLFMQADGLPNDIAQSIIEAGDGHFWISTLNGIADLQYDDDQSVHIRSFDALDGLQDNFFMNSCATRLPSGMLAFGGANGMSLFLPGDIRPDSVPPLTQLSDFLLSNRSVPIGAMENGRVVLQKSIAETPEIVLNYHDNVLSFEFVSLHFAEPRNNRFAYKLEGFDPDWVYADADKRFAHYTNLPYKEFTFWVKSANGDGVWSEPVQVKVRVRPPFWLTWWAYCIYSLLALALLYVVWRVMHLRAEYRASLALERLEREKSEELHQMKIQFFTNISHELRTPLTLIISPLEQLLRENAANRSLQKTLTLIHQNAGKLLTMISQLLDFRKSEAGLMQVRAEQTDLGVYVQEILLSFKPLAEQHKIRLSFEAPPEDPEVWIDHDQMEKVLFNLLSNAFKFTPDGGSVAVRLHSPTGAPVVEISVSDTGPGIPENELVRIFDPFHQGAHQPGRTLFGGTGIGLSLVKSIVDQHGGQIRAQNLPGSGALFTVTLPLGKSHLSPGQIAEPGHTRGIAPSFYMVAENDPEPETTAIPAAGSNAPRYRLLLVEDNPEIRSYLSQNLQNEYEVEEAADGMEALEKALEHTYDLVLSDIAMPEMDGIELCRRLKTNLLTSHIPVVLLTARTSLLHKIEGLETGADDYITKPFNLQLLQLRIRNLIAIRERLKTQSGKSLELSPSALTVTSIDEEFLVKFIRIVEEHMDESEYSIDDLAHQIAMSRMQLYRKLKALTGETPNTLIRNIRLKRAAQLLDTRQFNISEVAYKVGFTDLKYFRERFKERFGVVPSEYFRSEK
ncbi:MAG TPA: two-component regulator propeller domain-containing protein [Saprospiraceae bacterium]|nr:two-component regulator propeller domain-containing protein [Saprospiraceae bacterium]HPI07041.1 two-component regulator propeller domain-containing protein [Saprospiraceae bacterium]